VHKADSTYSKYGLTTLLFSKFLIGFDAVAVPLAGRAQVSAIRFPAFDAVGAGLYAAACASLGYVFRNQKDLVAVHVVRMGRFMLLAAAAVVGFCVVRRLVRWLRFLSEYRLARITPEQLNEKLNAGEDILVVDLQGDRRRTHGSIGIPGSSA
jgi:membrane protein DedA with SNARE-associated domain